jgi:t-SNARE complex subunit (syntaxin)
MINIMLDVDQFRRQTASPTETPEDAKENIEKGLESLISAQQFLVERFTESISATGDEERRAENIINIERQIEDITRRMQSLVAALR